MKRVMAILLLSIGAVSAAWAQDDAPKAPKDGDKFHLWLYWHTALADDGNVAKTLEMIQRMKKAGYTGLALRDNLQHRPSEQTDAYRTNVKKVRQACTDNGIDLVAKCLPLGYANDLMVADPNLAAAMPVVDAPFVVKEGKIVPDDGAKLLNGDFAEHKDNKPAHWVVDAPGKGLYVDTDVPYKGKPSIRMEEIKKNGEGSHMRAHQIVKVKPFAYYHMSVAVKTEDYKGQDNRLMALGPKGRLNWPEFPETKPTQDWVVYHKTFNTQDSNEVDIYIGSWDGRTGKIWFADVKFEPAGLSDMVRRPGAPFKAVSADGKTQYAEGKDLPEMKDPGLGLSPYKGGYQWHEGPQPKLPEGSSLKDGDKLLLSYCHTAVMAYGDQVPMCQSEPKTYEVLDQVIQSIARNAQPDFWFLEHDEIRMMGWCKACQDSGKTCGQILADHIAKCYHMVQKASPRNKGVFVWNDMFDPFDNARKEPYALVRGPTGWNGSWEGLPKAMGLINWTADKPDSVKFFSKEGHPQIISGCDGDQVVKILKESGGNPGVVGAIYVTWEDDFSKNVENYAKAVLDWKKAQK